MTSRCHPAKIGGLIVGPLRVLLGLSRNNLVTTGVASFVDLFGCFGNRAANLFDIVDVLRVRVAFFRAASSPTYWAQIDVGVAWTWTAAMNVGKQARNS